jgi:adenosylcobyric acid synthase
VSSLLICGTSSDAGKSVIVAGLCRFLRDAGVSVAPFKAQNMSLNSAVTAEGAEIGRAQAAQAFAAGIEPEAAMNPILIKPSTDTLAQVMLMGHPIQTVEAATYGSLTQRLLPVVIDAFDSLRSRFDVVICEGAGSLAEFNLRDRDLVNLGFARQRSVPVILVADIDRGGSFAALYGSLALLSPLDQALVSGFILNKFRGDQRLLVDGLTRFSAAAGRPFYGVLPWVKQLLAIDAEDALDLQTLGSATADAPGRPVTVAVIRLAAMSNFTDFEPLALEPDVVLQFTQSAGAIATADLVVLPGTKATVADLARIRELGLDRILAERARARRPILGICGGFQMLGQRIVDPVESGLGEVAGVGLLPVETTFEPDKLLARRTGTSPPFGANCHGYEIRHGRPLVLGGCAMFETADGPEGCVHGSVIGTSWHGVFECDAFRTSFLAWVATENGFQRASSDVCFADAREAQTALLGALLRDHADTDGLLRLIEQGAPAGLPTLSPAGVP